jgi:hypothetical protein
MMAASPVRGDQDDRSPRKRPVYQVAQVLAQLLMLIKISFIWFSSVQNI